MKYSYTKILEQKKLQLGSSHYPRYFVPVKEFTSSPQTSFRWLANYSERVSQPLETFAECFGFWREPLSETTCGGSTEHPN